MTANGNDIDAVCQILVGNLREDGGAEPEPVTTGEFVGCMCVA